MGGRYTKGIEIREGSVVEYLAVRTSRREAFARVGVAVKKD